MSEVFFGRVWEIEIVNETRKKVEEDASTDKARTKITNYLTYVPKTDEEIISEVVSTQRRVTFSSEDGGTSIDFQLSTKLSTKSVGKSTSSGVLKLVNIARNQISNLINKNTKIIISAGYENGSPLSIIFQGTVVGYNTEKLGTNVVTSIALQDSGDLVNSVRASISVKSISDTSSKGIDPNDVDGAGGEKFANGRDVLLAIADMWKTLGVSYRLDSSVFLDALLDEKYSKRDRPIKQLKDFRRRGGYSSSGTLRDITNTYCKDFGYIWFIDRGILHMYPNTTDSRNFNFKKNLVEIDPSSIKSIGHSEPLAIENMLKPRSEQIKVSCVLDSRVTGGTIISIPVQQDDQGISKIANSGSNIRITELVHLGQLKAGVMESEFGGYYFVESTSFELDTRSNKWDLVFTAKRVSSSDSINLDRIEG